MYYIVKLLNSMSKVVLLNFNKFANRYFEMMKLL